MSRRRRRPDATAPARPPLTKAQIARAATLILATGVLGWGAIAGTAAAITRSSNPGIALRFDSTDAEALARLADQHLMGGEKPESARQTRELAVRSLAAQPLNPIALRVLGFLVEREGRKSEAQTLIRTAAAMSRRDAPAQLWLIEDAVNRGDITGALAHYDIALRVSPSAQALLFPILTNALSEPDIQQGVGRFFRSPPSWLLGFLYHAIDRSERPQDVARTIMRAGGLPQTAEFKILQPRLLARLSAMGRYRALREYYESLPGADRALLTSAGFARHDFTPELRPIAWELTEDAALDTGRDERKGGLEIFAATGTSGVAARKILFLEPGSYSLGSVQRIIDPSKSGNARWSLNCLNADGVIPFWRSTDLRPGSTTWSIRVPEDHACPAYSLELEVSGGQSPSGFALAVDRLALRSVRAGA